MKTPTPHFTALALALILAGAQTAAYASAPEGFGAFDAVSGSYWTGPDDAQKTSGGKTIVPDDFVGPLAPNQIRASDAAKSDLGSFAATTNALQGIGALQCSDSGVAAPDPRMVAAEDRGKADGTLKDVIRQPNGAILVFPDGKVSWSDYVKSDWSAPFDPAACGSNPSCPAELKAYAEKQAQKEKERRETSQQEKNMFQANMFAADAGGDRSTPPDAQTPSSETPGQDPVQMAANDLGNGLGSQFLDDFGGPSAFSDNGGSAPGEVGQAEVPALENVRYTFTDVQKASDKAAKIVDEVSRKMGQDASGRKDLDANAAPSKRIVVTPQ
ncbi:MAG: hypothetical protein A2V88_02530 [Elusimicrobia bacterium RBG_16_66_12]|nr:MAG: hypothetical protein A2V88_02530 [Elusimicrobia bacterium RBG_16_66_12]